MEKTATSVDELNKLMLKIIDKTKATIAKGTPDLLMAEQQANTVRAYTEAVCMLANSIVGAESEIARSKRDW